MMKSGVPIVQALEIIGGGNKNPAMKKMVDSLRTDIEGGASIYEAMSQLPVQFDELYRNLVRAGESSGVLETVLDTIATYKENIESIKGKIKKALFYPATVIAVAILVSADPADLRGADVPRDLLELRRRPAGVHQAGVQHLATSW